MEKQNIYQDISARTGGEIYLGVVGPVRSGKSTFIKRFMELLVLPEIKDENERKRTMDELHVVRKAKYDSAFTFIYSKRSGRTSDGRYENKNTSD